MVTIADSNLRFLLAAALSIPVTRGFAGQTELARPIRASELSTLTSLDLSGRNITNLSGLGYATTLKFLNLSNNPNLTSISELKPRLSTEAADAGAALGLSQLRHLALDSTGVGDLSPLKQIDRLQGLTADYTTITNLAPLTAMKQLEFLSIDDRPTGAAFTGRLTDLYPLANLSALRALSLTSQNISNVYPLGALDQLQYLYLHNNLIADLQGLTNVRLINNGNAGYAEAGMGWLGDQNVAAFSQDYRVLAPDTGPTATWRFTNLPPGFYDVQATWPAIDTRSMNVTYSSEAKPTYLSAKAAFVSNLPATPALTSPAPRNVIINTENSTITGDDDS
ncbi:MAG: hypothetical protein ACKOU6_11895, partial [Planctomycetota bacterium]